MVAFLCIGVIFGSFQSLDTYPSINDFLKKISKASKTHHRRFIIHWFINTTALWEFKLRSCVSKVSYVKQHKRYLMPKRFVNLWIKQVNPLLCAGRTKALSLTFYWSHDAHFYPPKLSLFVRWSTPSYLKWWQ